MTFGFKRAEDIVPSPSTNVVRLLLLYLNDSDTVRALSSLCHN
jgi:hypothetical protein